MGTCLGQDLRKLVKDGVPPQMLYGSDIFADYEGIGHALFRDVNTFRNRFMAADLVDEAINNAEQRDVVNIFTFLHMYNWDDQVRACKRIMQLLSRKPGNVVIGTQTGSIEPEEQAVKPPFVAEGEHKTIYRHSIDPFTEMWKIVERDEGVELKVVVEYDDQTDRDRRAKEETTEEKGKLFVGPEQRRLFFIVEVL